MRLTRPSLLIVVSFLAVVGVSPTASRAYRQSTPDHSHRGHKRPSAAYMLQQGQSNRISPELRNLPKIPIGVDGSKTPELVPDSLAYRHFIRATASTDSQGVRRRDALLGRTGLTTPERLIYATAIAGVGATLERVRQQRRTPSLTPETLQQLKNDEDAAFEQAEAGIRATLATDAAARLDAYVKGDFKRKIRIFSGDSMK